MNKEIQDIFNRFEGDFTSLALYAYLSPLLNANERQLISLKEVSAKTGFGRRRLLKSLDRLTEMGIILHEIKPGNGVLVLANVTSAIHFVTSEFTNVNSALTNDTSALTNVNSLTELEVPGITERSEVIKPLLKEEGLDLRLKPKTSTSAKVIPKPKSKSLSTAGRKPRTKAKPKEKTLGARIWEAYADEYQKVYGIVPPRNAQNNTMTSNLGKKLGEEGLEVIRFYVHHKDKFFILNRHDIRFALNSANRIYSDWKLGTNMPTFEAAQKEKEDRIHKIFENL